MKHYYLELNIKHNNKENRPKDNVTKSGKTSGITRNGIRGSCHHNILLYAGIESLAPPRLHTAMTLQHVTMQANNAYQTIKINIL